MVISSLKDHFESMSWIHFKVSIYTRHNYETCSITPSNGATVISAKKYAAWATLTDVKGCCGVLGKYIITYTICYRYYLQKKYQATLAAACPASSPSTSRIHMESSRLRCSESHSSRMVDQPLPRRNCQQGLAVTCTQSTSTQKHMHIQQFLGNLNSVHPPSRSSVSISENR